MPEVFGFLFGGWSTPLFSTQFSGFSNEIYFIEVRGTNLYVNDIDKELLIFYTSGTSHKFYTSGTSHKFDFIF